MGRFTETRMRKGKSDSVPELHPTAFPAIESNSSTGAAGTVSFKNAKNPFKD